MDTVAFVSGIWHVSLHVVAVMAATAILLRALRVGAPDVRLRLVACALVVAVISPALWALVAPGAAVHAGAAPLGRGAAGVWMAALLADPVRGWLIPADVVASGLLLGVVVRLSWLLAGSVRVRRAAAVGVPAHISDEMATHQAQVGTHAVIEWRRDLTSASTVGLFPARVLLPLALAGADPATRRAVVCHELVHVRRRDWGSLVVEELMRAAFWFHPAVHWAAAEMRLAREQLVDGEVVALTGARRHYLELLLSYGEPPAAALSAATVPFFGRRQLERRIRHLAREVTMTRTRAGLTLLGALLTMAAAGGTVSYLFPIAHAQAFVPADAARQQAEADKTPPRVLYKVDAAYPEDAKAAHVEGTVVVAGTIETDGTVSTTRVVESIPMLDAAAQHALTQWRFEPARVKGKPVKVEVSIKFNFTLK